MLHELVEVLPDRRGVYGMGRAGAVGFLLTEGAYCRCVSVLAFLLAALARPVTLMSSVVVL
jgi:hypothetical protein